MPRLRVEQWGNNALQPAPTPSAGDQFLLHFMIERDKKTKHFLSSLQHFFLLLNWSRNQGARLCSRHAVSLWIRKRWSSYLKTTVKVKQRHCTSCCYALPFSSQSHLQLAPSAAQKSSPSPPFGPSVFASVPVGFWPVNLLPRVCPGWTQHPSVPSVSRFSPARGCFVLPTLT